MQGMSSLNELLQAVQLSPPSEPLECLLVLGGILDLVSSVVDCFLGAVSLQGTLQLRGEAACA